MGKLQVECQINGQMVTVDELKLINYERNKHVLHEMKSLGASVVGDNRDLSHSEIDQLSYLDANEINIATRGKYSPTEIENLYRDKIKIAEQMWRRICVDFDLKTSPVKISQTYMKIMGVDPDLIINGKPTQAVTDFETPEEKMKRIAKEASASALEMHPEHFFITTGPNGLYGMETFGMYGEPFPQLIKPGDPDQVPIDRDESYPVVSTGLPTLLDGTPLYTIPFHQYKPLKNGIELKLAVVMPETTPDEIISGHEIHLATEFWKTAEINVL
ncbi:hypothetical protein [Ligilactobacillus acidipiscis]|uniref:hypothetical protein n=1 Tax=Ligilactobacillus acidipiscis TaxID=89059 RepID=UPI0023F61B85|nr:hypothetical protein [Ligilactobacillus acidipiscis]WEV57445.1 hypothetical protein OZX66_02555 [Ligilactobacillus acidipiscis]